MKIKDMPKLKSPYIREKNENKDYVVTQEIDPDFEWVFTDPLVQAHEKLDGTNVSIVWSAKQIGELRSSAIYLNMELTSSWVSLMTTGIPGLMIPAFS